MVNIVNLRVQCQAEHAVQSVKDAAESAVDHAGAAADSAQLQAHRAADAVQQVESRRPPESISLTPTNTIIHAQAGEQAAQMTQDAAAAVKDAATGGN